MVSFDACRHFLSINVLRNFANLLKEVDKLEIRVRRLIGRLINNIRGVLSPFDLIDSFDW